MVTQVFLFRISLTLGLLYTIISSGLARQGFSSKWYQKSLKDQRPLSVILDPANQSSSETMEPTKSHKTKRVQKTVRHTSKLSNVPEDNEISLLKAISSGPPRQEVLYKWYKKSIKEQRPLILVIDPPSQSQSENMGPPKSHRPKRVQKNVRHTSKLSNVPEDQVGGNEISILKTLIKKVTALVRNRKITVNGPKKVQGLKAGLRTKEDLVAPLIKNLLRVSNDMNCAAREECEVNGETKDECSDKFECREENKDGQNDDCAVGEANECVEKKQENADDACAVGDGDQCVDEKQDNDNNGCGVGGVDECEQEQVQSTKGYILEPETKTCTRC